MSRSPGITVALAQMAPRLGALDDNLERHHLLIGQAREEGADLVVFPELGLTGYLLQDLNAEVAMRRDDPRLLALAQAADGHVRRRLLRRGIGRSTGSSSRRPCWRRAGSVTSTARSSCPPTASSTSAASSPQARGCAP